MSKDTFVSGVSTLHSCTVDADFEKFKEKLPYNEVHLAVGLTREEYEKVLKGIHDKLLERSTSEDGSHYISPSVLQAFSGR